MQALFLESLRNAHHREHQSLLSILTHSFVPVSSLWCTDYLTKVVVLGKSSSELPVSNIMTPQSKLMTVSPQQSVVDVMTLMTDNNFRHVPVVCLPHAPTTSCSEASCKVTLLLTYGLCFLIISSCMAKWLQLLAGLHACK